MDTSIIYIAPQRMETVYRELGNDLGHTLEMLTSKLTYGFQMPFSKSGGTPREYVELREARSIVNQLKYPDPRKRVRTEDMAWALKRVRDMYRSDMQWEGMRQFEKAASILGIDLAESHIMPADLFYKIGNELKLAA